jgi:hypothetical protein
MQANRHTAIAHFSCFFVDILRVRKYAFLLLKPRTNHKVVGQRIADRVEFMRLFRRKGEGMKRWRLRALLVNPHETKLTLSSTSKPRRVPPWFFREMADAAEK